ncbi:hypothetical protein TSUD_53070 [Trifolium subterraneum]|uniref:Uncharacterized protein n=1 Tax=Trifolium subterraneum TaxID=3900 RepID=A0A2Z6N122_TRISU|nr:hypothetical protein TSUD_53070 [Trifolium subterraneum]
MLFGCSESRQVWIEIGMSNVIEPRVQQSHDVKIVLLDICKSKNVDVAGSAIVIAWCLWYNHNNWVWNILKDTPTSIATRAAQLIAEWRAVNSLQQQSRQFLIVAEQQ